MKKKFSFLTKFSKSVLYISCIVYSVERVKSLFLGVMKNLKTQKQSEKTQKQSEKTQKQSGKKHKNRVKKHKNFDSCVNCDIISSEKKIKKDREVCLIIPDKNLEVRKSEAILKARYNLGELALKLVSIIYSNVKRSDEEGKDYQIRVADIAKLMGKNYGEMYNLLKEATDELLENPIRIEDKENKSWVSFNWISDAMYKDGTISFTISKRLKPYILDLQTKFVKYRLANILSLKGNYIIRLYEILKDWYELNKRYGNKAEKIIKIDELREMLEIPKSYQYSSHIKQRILEKAQKELAEHTDIIFNFEEIKTGRKVTHLKFIIQENPKKSEDYLISQEMSNLKSVKHFVTYLRENYSGNLKFFGYKTIKEDNKIKNAWLYLNNKGLVCGVTEDNERIDFNAIESERIYYNWWQVAKTDPNYYYLVLEKQEDFREIYNTDIEFRTNLNNTIIYLQEERKLK